jgi:phospholipid-binding lipoprotein MlaA
MKTFFLGILLFTVLVAGCAHGPNSPSTFAQPPDAIKKRQDAIVPKSEQSPQNYQAISEKSDNESIDYIEEESAEKKLEIADPLEPFNRAMYHFNDKLYFWALKPVAQGYKKVVPEGARISISNFFSNIAFPIRFVNCLLQANFEGAASEFARFTVNTIWGVAGLFDPASSKEINLRKQDEDFGQSLGVYGLGQGFYINWPIFGPSSPRDTVGLIGDLFLHPLTYLDPWEASAGTKAYDKVNETSLRIGDYESLKEAAIDPYVAIRDAYVQYRQKKVKARGTKTAPSVNEAMCPASDNGKVISDAKSKDVSGN